MKNDFYNDLRFSHSQASAPWWTEVYDQFFPDRLGDHDLRSDGWWQKAGIDRQIVMKGKNIYVDEKVRRDKWTDFALEYVSNSVTGAPGWIAKDLRADYIAYAFAPMRTCYLLAVNELQNAWRQNSTAWIRKYGEKRAVNDGYDTLFCPVPRTILAKAMLTVAKATWNQPAPAPKPEPTWEVVDTPRPPVPARWDEPEELGF